MVRMDHHKTFIAEKKLRVNSVSSHMPTSMPRFELGEFGLQSHPDDVLVRLPFEA